MKLVYVEWIDSNSGGTWESIEYIKDREPSRSLACKSAGWLLLNTEDRIVIAPSITALEDAHQTALAALTIPKVAITKIFYVELDDEQPDTEKVPKSKEVAKKKKK